MNAASLAGLIPGLPGSALDSVCRAFLICLSQALALENRRDGVQVMVICPGHMHTEFDAVLGVEDRIQRRPGLFWMGPDALAQRVQKAPMTGRIVVVPGLVNKAIAALAALLPEGATSALSSVFSRRYR